MKSLFTLLSICLLLLVACGDSETLFEPADPCDQIMCLNGGACVDGTCDCPSGYSGAACETYTSVEIRLQTETPLEIVESGIPVDSLYGKVYAGGYIFFVDVNNIIAGKEGMVCALENLPENYGWGCDEIDSDAINLASDPVYPVETAEGGRPGDGIMNTADILASACALGSAAEACTDYISSGYDDWFLPARGAVFLMYLNLEAPGRVVNFDGRTLWTSSEKDEDATWVVEFAGGAIYSVGKSSSVKVRPVRAF